MRSQHGLTTAPGWKQVTSWISGATKRDVLGFGAGAVEPSGRHRATVALTATSAVANNLFSFCRCARRATGVGWRAPRSNRTTDILNVVCAAAGVG